MDLFFLCMALMISPIVACPIRLADGYVLPQIGAAYLLVAISTIFFISRGIIPTNASAMIGGLFLVYFVMSATWSTVPHNSITDIPLVFASVMVFIISSVLFGMNRNYMVVVSLAAFCVSMFTSCYGIAQKMLIDPFFPERLKSREAELKDLPDNLMPMMFKNRKWADSRAISTLGNTNFAAGFFCSTLPFLAFLSIEVSAWFAISIIVCVAAIVMTKSRAGLLALFTSAILFLLMTAESGIMLDFYLNYVVGMKPELMALVMVLIAYFGIEFLIRTRKLWPKFQKDNEINNFLDIEHTHQDHPVAHLRYRFRYWAAAWHLLKKRPLSGFGLRTYRKEVYEAQAELNNKDDGKFLGYGHQVGKFLGYGYQTPQPRECHNDFIEYFVEGGVAGGLLFLFAIGAVFYGFYLSEMSLLGIAVLSSMCALLVNAFFFFPMRLGSSAIMFWASLALLDGITGSVRSIYIGSNPVLIAFSVALLAALFYEGVYKPNASNYYFSRYGLATSFKEKEKMLHKCMTLRPYDTMPRTHAVIGYAANFPDVAMGHAEVLNHHFDGMSPAWMMMFNLGLTNAANKRWTQAARCFERSMYYYPAFEPSRQELGRVWSLAAFPKGGIILKTISTEGIAILDKLKSETEKLKVMLNSIQLESLSIVQTERLKLNVPLDWAFDIEENTFVPSANKPDNKQIVFVGMARIPLLVPANMVATNK